MPYVEHFKELAIKFDNKDAYRKLINTEIRFVKNDGKHLGRCYFVFNVIHINEFFWKHSDHAEREEVVFHELGHCVLGLDDVPKGSIMQANNMLGKDYVNRYSYLINKLFGCETGNCVDLKWDESRYEQR